MESRTKEGKHRIKMLRDEKVEKINNLFDEINSFVAELYEGLFDEEDIEEVKSNLVKTINKIKPDDYKAD